MRHHFHLHHFFGRHPGGRGIGRFGRGFIDDGGMGGRGDRPFGMGRKMSSADLQLLILRLLADKPCHGYELIKAFEERSKGFYTPSPGMVYPALTYLEELGLATVETEGTRKLYHITAAGRAHLDEHRTAVDALFARFERVAERMERVRRVFRTEAGGEDLAGAAGRHGSAELLRARRELRAALEGKVDSSIEEQRRVAEILRRAAAQISGDATAQDGH